MTIIDDRATNPAPNEPKREWVHSWKPTEYDEPPYVRRPRTYTCSKCGLTLTEPQLRREGNTCPRFV